MRIFKATLLILLILFLGFSSYHPLISKADTNSDNEIIFQASNITAHLVVESETVELGNSIVVKYGITENSTLYLPNYDYNLTLYNDENAYSHIGTTKTNIAIYKFDTLRSEGLISPGNYNISLHLNGTTGEYNAEQKVVVITKAGVDLLIKMKSGNQIIYSNYRPYINSITKIEILVINVGTSNAFDVNLEFTSINEPVGLQPITSQKINIALLQPLENVTGAFYINATSYGKGEVSVYLEYTNGVQNKYIKSEKLTTIVEPAISIDFEPPKSINIDESEEYKIILTNLAYRTFDIHLTIFSDTINFLQQNIETTIGILEHEIIVLGTPTRVGWAQIEIRLYFVDPTDGDIVEIGNPFTLGIDVSEGISPSDFDPTQIVLGILVLINGIILAFILFLYYKDDLRKKLMEKVFQVKYMPDIEFPSSSIIVDGSNIAWEEVSKRGKPQVSNIHLCIKHLKENGFSDILVVADAALRYQIESTSELDDAADKEIIKVLPAKVNADNFILRLSAQRGSLILTNDLFKEYRTEFPWIDERRVPYTIMAGIFYLHPLFKSKKQKNKK